MDDVDDEEGRGSVPRRAAQTAITELVARKVLGQEQAGDRQRAAALLEVLDGGHSEDRAIFAAAIGAVCVAWNELGKWDAESRRAAFGAARSLPSRDAPAHLTTLGAIAVGLMAFAGFSDTPGADATRAAEVLRTVQHYELASWVARRALTELELTVSERTRVLIMLAVVDHDISAGEEAMRLAETLDVEDPGRRRAEALWPNLDFLGSRRSDVELRAALEDGDRAGAARRMAETIAPLRTPEADDPHLAGLHRAVLGLAASEIDIGEVRRGMQMVIGHWRELRRTGATPPAARAGIENVIGLLKRDLTGAAPQLLFEIVEALADHGLSATDETAFRESFSDVAAGELVHAQMSATAAEAVSWPDITWIVSRLGTTHIVLTHTERRFSDGRLEVTALQLRPPIHPALNQMSLDPSAQATLDRLASQDFESIEDVSEEELQALISLILPPPLLSALSTDPSPPPVVVVPDGPLWAVPWHAVSPKAPVVIAPSMTLHAGLDPPHTPIRRILSFIDETIPGADVVIGALAKLDAAGCEITRGRVPGDLAEASAHDLLLVFAHGSGHGLNYRLALPGGVITALDLANARPSARAVIASCWSGRIPPPSFPLSLPNALLLAGCRTIIGGLWPLPALATSTVLADALLQLRAGTGLARAIHCAVRAADTYDVAERFGLATFGTIDRSVR